MNETYEEKVSARISKKTKAKLVNTNREALIVRIALDEFFAKHKTDAAIIEATVRYHSKKS